MKTVKYYRLNNYDKNVSFVSRDLQNFRRKNLEICATCTIDISFLLAK